MNIEGGLVHMVSLKRTFSRPTNAFMIEVDGKFGN